MNKLQYKLNLRINLNFDFFKSSQLSQQTSDNASH